MLHSSSTSLTILLKLGEMGYSSFADINVQTIAKRIKHGAFYLVTAMFTRYLSARLHAK